MVSWEIEYNERCQRDKEELMSYFENWQRSGEIKLDEILNYLGDLRNKSDLESQAKLKQDMMIEALKLMMQDVCPFSIV